MNTAQTRLLALVEWFVLSSAPRSTPLGDATLVGPWAAVVPCDFALPSQLAFHPEALPLFVQAEQVAGLSLPTIDVSAPASQGHAADRLSHLLWRIGDGTLPPAIIVGLTDPAECPQGAIVRAGVNGLDPTALPIICTPLWALPAMRRTEIARKLPLLPA